MRQYPGHNLRLLAVGRLGFSSNSCGLLQCVCEVKNLAFLNPTPQQHHCCMRQSRTRRLRAWSGLMLLRLASRDVLLAINILIASALEGPWHTPLRGANPPDQIRPDRPDDTFCLASASSLEDLESFSWDYSQILSAARHESIQFSGMLLPPHGSQGVALLFESPMHAQQTCQASRAARTSATMRSSPQRAASGRGSPAGETYLCAYCSMAWA